jgi:hypothetical protein
MEPFLKGFLGFYLRTLAEYATLSIILAIVFTIVIKQKLYVPQI